MRPKTPDALAITYSPSSLVDDLDTELAALLHAGGGFAAVDYSLAPGASLDTMVTQCREAVAWLYRHAAGYGHDPRRIHVAGHSAGGHLAAMLLSTPWAERFGVPRRRRCATAQCSSTRPALHL